jgi:hypothetical protein
MSYLYKRSNLFWHFLIRSQLTYAVWRPLVEITRRRHLRFRQRLTMEHEADLRPDLAGIIAPGV